MGKIHQRSVRFVDSRIKNDGKLLRCVKLHPAIYDKNHKFHRNKQEQEKIWKHIAGCLQKSVSNCKERWHQLVQEYKACHNVLTLHDALFDLIKECIKKDIQAHDFCFDEIEDDVLSTLFSEPGDTQLDILYSTNISIENIDNDTNAIMNNRVFFNERAESLNENRSDFVLSYCSYSDSETEPIDAACSVFHCDSSFTEENFYQTPNFCPTSNLFYNEEDFDDYHPFFRHNLNKFPVIFTDIVDTLLDYLDEDTSDEVRGDVVKCPYNKVYNHNFERKQ